MRKRALLFEINNYHFECLPGTAWYLKKLGYDVDVMTQYNPDAKEVFCQSGLEVQNVYYDAAKWEEELSEIIQTNNYDLVFTNSFEHGAPGQNVDFSRRFEKCIQDHSNSHLPIMGYYHSISDIQESQDDEHAKSGRVAMLSHNVFENYEMPMVNPHHFLETHGPHSKNNVPVVASVGISNNRFQIEAALLKVKKAKSVIKVDFIGGGNKKKTDSIRKRRVFGYPICKLLRIKPYDDEGFKAVPYCLVRSLIQESGRVSFPDMYEHILKADFIVSNFFTGNPSFHFENDRTTGAKQLSLGFIRPMIIQREYAEAYGFDDSTAVIYEKGELYKGFQRALSMTADEYNEMCEKLVILEKKITDESLTNLEQMIQGTERRA